MESIHYVSTVTNCYKAAVDAYLESPEKFEAIKQDLVDEMWKVAQRELATGFYYGIPSENEQLFGARRKIPEYKFVAEVISYDDATQTATIRQRNVINEGDQVEFYGPGFRHFETYIEDLHDAKGNKIDRAPNPMELLTIKVPQPTFILVCSLVIWSPSVVASHHFISYACFSPTKQSISKVLGFVLSELGMLTF
ncbi:peptidase%2C U32 family [Streptococcus pneumoniae]|nr:peptidase%2C U32 family [Streptococcus pneumoniae]